MTLHAFRCTERTKILALRPPAPSHPSGALDSHPEGAMCVSSSPNEAPRLRAAATSVCAGASRRPLGRLLPSVRSPSRPVSGFARRIRRSAETPLDHMDTVAGMNEVKTMLYHIEYGLPA